MARTSRISFRDEDEIREFDIGAAIDDDVKLKPKPKKRHSLVELQRHFKQNDRDRRAAIESGPITCKPIIHSRRRTSNSPVMPSVSCGSPTPPPLPPLVPKPALARVKRKDVTVRKIDIVDGDKEDEPSLEIPEENIKTLLTLGFMSSLAFNVNESDDSDESLSDSQIDQIIETNRRIEKLATMRYAPKPVKSMSNGQFSRIPVLTHFKRKDFTEEEQVDFSTMESKPRCMKNLPISTHVTKWSIDGRIIGKPPSARTSTASLLNRPKKEPKQTVSEGRVKMYGSRMNFNAHDRLGPWKVKETTKSQEGFVGHPPTPKISEKYVFNNKPDNQPATTAPAVSNPKSWFEQPTQPRAKTQLKAKKRRDDLPRMQLIV